jgi:AraC family transcriptional regulator
MLFSANQTAKARKLLCERRVCSLRQYRRTDDAMSVFLETGQFYGTPRQRIELGGVVLTELIHRSGCKLPRHSHESAYFGLLVRGSYSECCAQRSVDYASFSTGFHPPALTHSDEVGPGGAQMLCIELRESFLTQTRPFLTAPEFLPYLCASEITWLALRLFRSFAEGTLSLLEVQELCSDMLERASGANLRGESRIPVWLKRAVELLHAGFRHPITLEMVAANLGVHPVHLSRTFRKYHGSTMADYVNGLRVQFVCRALQAGSVELASIAGQAGFADQSHMGRVFKACTGQTPGRFRNFLSRRSLG